MVSFLRPFSLNGSSDPAGICSRRIEVQGGCAIAAAVSVGEFEDICVQAIDSSSTLQVDDMSMCGEVFWLRRQHGVLRQVIAVNASMLTRAGDVLFEEREPVSHVFVHLWENGMVIQRGDEEGNVYVRDLRGREFQRN
jgi:hypothetical protein